MSKSIVELQRDKLKIGVINLTDESVAAGVSYNFLSHYYPGSLDESLVISPNENFSVKVVVDGATVFNLTYAQYKSITQVVKCISAFEERDEHGNPLGKYLVQIKNLSFVESLVISVTNTGGSSTTFHNLFAKYKTM